MLTIVRSNRFMKDLKTAQKRGLDLNILDDVITKLANQEVLEPKYKDHSLTGVFQGFRECHVKPDWLLIYCVEDEELELFLLRTGTHSDLFK